MRQFYFALQCAVLTALLAMSYSGGAKADTTEEFVFTNSGFVADDVTLQGTGCTVEMKKNNGSTKPAWNNSNNEARLYAGGLLIVTTKSTTANIKKIVYTYVANANNRGKKLSVTASDVTPAGFDPDTKTWESETPASVVTMSPTGTAGNFGFTKLEITYADDGGSGTDALTPANFAFTPATLELTVGDNFTSPTFSTADDYDGTATFTSSNEALATVSSEGVISLVSGATGTATITASAAATTTFTAGNATCVITVNKKTATLTYEPTTATLTVGATFSQPALTKSPEDLTVTFASNNENVATVDANTGAITLVEGATGTAVITASSAETAEYKAASATFTITVEAAAAGALDLPFYESFNNYEYKDETGYRDFKGGNDGIWNQSGSTTIDKVTKVSLDKEGWTSQYTYPGSQCVRVGKSAGQGWLKTPALNITGNAVLTFKAAVWTGDEKTFILSATNADIDMPTVQLLEEGWGDYTVNITNVTGPVSITFKGKQATKAVFFLDEVRVFDPATMVSVPIVYDDLYATLYYSDKALTVPAGIVATTYAVTDGTLSETKRYVADDVIPAETAVVMKADAKKTYFFEVAAEGAGEAPTQNMLCGTDAAALTTAPSGMGDVYYYMLTYAAGSTDPATLGFYWGNATGAAFTNGAHKAYLVAPKSQASNVRAFVIGGHGGTTAITAATVGTPDADAPAYNLAGQRVGAAYKGIVIVNGKKMIRK